MPSPARLRIVPNSLCWEVLTGGPKRMIDILCSRDRAIEHALEIASQATLPTVIVVENRDGSTETLRATRGRRPRAA